MSGQSMTHKILARASGRDSVRSGEFVEVKVDMCFTHDPVLEGLREVFYDEFGADAKVWDPERIALFQDHLVPAKDRASRRLAMAMDSFAAEQGLPHYYPYGSNYGVCHIVMCEQGHVLPGTVVLGTDSHSVTYGAFNAFGTGVGMVDMVNVFRTGRLWFIIPEIIRVKIEGSLAPHVYAKDLILKLIGDLGMGGASGKTIEFEGSTIDAMSAEERMTLANMVVEAGAKNGIMSLSQNARDYLSQVSSSDYAVVTSDPDVEYLRTIEIDASKLEPVVAYPHRPDNVHSIGETKDKGIKVHQVYVGSCTGAKLTDIGIVADLMKGNRVANGVRMVVVPASSKIYASMAENGMLATLVQAGAVVESPGCKACYGAHGAVPGDNEVCLATTNRNFRGRMGNPDSDVYLASPHVAAMTAIVGHITD